MQQVVMKHSLAPDVRPVCLLLRSVAQKHRQCDLCNKHLKALTDLLRHESTLEDWKFSCIFLPCHTSIDDSLFPSVQILPSCQTYFAREGAAQILGYSEDPLSLPSFLPSFRDWPHFCATRPRAPAVFIGPLTEAEFARGSSGRTVVACARPYLDTQGSGMQNG